MDIAFSAGKYLSWGVLSISLANFLVIVAMVAVFVLALVVPFPRGRGGPSSPATPEDPSSAKEDES